MTDESTSEVIEIDDTNDFIESFETGIKYDPAAVDFDIEPVDGYEVVRVNKNFTARSYNPPDGNIWILSDGTQEIQVLFPDTQNLKIQDGYLVNTGTSNIQGVVLEDGIDLSNYFRDIVTILPLYSSGSQNTAFRYNAHSYVTTYYTGGNGSTLATTVSYKDFQVVKRPYGFGISVADSIIIGLLLFSCIVSIIGGLMRR